MIRIGTSGWSYDHWTGVLYPPRTPPGRRLAVYAAEFDTVELNASFYRWPRDSTFAGWRQRLPDGFTMSVKAHRGLTHFRRLTGPEPWVERFRRCWDALGDRAEALLVQLHPDFERGRHDGLERLDHFLTVMPDHIPVAVEIRHPSWDAPGGVPAARTPRRRLCGDERRRPALHSPCDRATGVHPLARPRSAQQIPRLVSGARTAPVGGPDPQLAGRGPRRRRLFQQRPRRARRAQRPHAAAAAR